MGTRAEISPHHLKDRLGRPTNLGSLPNFADILRPQASIEEQTKINSRSRKLGLHLLPEETIVYAALKTPALVQEFMETNLPYNYQSSNTESCRSPRQVLIKGSAHCFEGALFTLAANFLNGHPSKIVLLEALEYYDHNLTVYQDPKTGLWGCNDECRSGSRGRPSTYKSIGAIARSFSRQETSGLREGYHGYSEPIDIVARFGTSWITAQDSSHIYYHYVDDSVLFHLTWDRNKKTFYYPLIEALHHKWIVADRNNRSKIAKENFSPRVRALWERYLGLKGLDYLHEKEFDSVLKKFYNLTGMTPQELEDQAYDFNYFLRRGFQPEELLAHTRKSRRLKVRN